MLIFLDRQGHVVHGLASAAPRKELVMEPLLFVSAATALLFRLARLELHAHKKSGRLYIINVILLQIWSGSQIRPLNLTNHKFHTSFEAE